MVEVHYFYDPLCGWCYGATAMVEALVRSDNIQLNYHPGGMMSRQEIAPTLRAHILESDVAIAKQTGASFGDAYKLRLSGSDGLVFDSYIAIRAILVAQKMGLDEAQMLTAIQTAHYQQGLPVEQLETLAGIADSLGLDLDTWHKGMQEAEAAVEEKTQESHRLMTRYQVQGYPTFVAETKPGPRPLAHAEYYHNAEGWRELLTHLA